MPRLSWNEIQNRAVVFAARWQGETYEKGESQTFWSEFLTVYGIDRRRHGAFFEYAVKKTGGKQGFIDLLWPGKLLADLYNLLTMPPELTRAHQALDRLYRRKPFESDKDRLELLFKRYRELRTAVDADLEGVS